MMAAPKHRRPRIWGISVAALLFAALAVGNYVFHPFSPKQAPDYALVAPSKSLTSSDDVVPPSSEPSVSSVPNQGCGRSAQPFEVAYLRLPRLNLVLPVQSLPLNSKDNSFPVPPFGVEGVDPAWSAALWKDGAQPGTGKGVAHFDVHTYTTGSAAGNMIGHRVKNGDTIELLDARRHVQVVYTVNDRIVWTYDNVDISRVSRFDGCAKIAIEMCWDSTADWGMPWGSRLYVLGRQAWARK